MKLAKIIESEKVTPKSFDNKRIFIFTPKLLLSGVNDNLMVEIGKNIMKFMRNNFITK